MPRIHPTSPRDEAMADLVLLSAARDDSLDDAVATFCATWGETPADVEAEVEEGAAPWHGMRAFDEHALEVGRTPVRTHESRIRKETHMRAIALLAAAALATAPSVASAQSVRGLLNTIDNSRISVGSGLCTYTRGLQALLCQASRVSAAASQVDDLRRQREYQRDVHASRMREEMDREQRVASALDRACRAGDRESCGRSYDGADRAVVSALLDACQAGDERSCRRAEDVRGGREYASR